jgi:hypothetical protein
LHDGLHDVGPTAGDGAAVANYKLQVLRIRTFLVRA